MATVYARSAAVNDAVYQRGLWKDDVAEAEEVHEVIVNRNTSAGTRLLDVGCGTGGHIPFFAQHYTLEGLDASAAILEIARHRSPAVTFHHADMINFDLGQRFDAVVCLFSSIGYVRSVDNLRQTVKRFADHLVRGGVVDGWYAPDQWRDVAMYATLVDEPDLKVARIRRNTRNGALSMMECHHMLARRSGVEYYVEHHVLGLLTVREYCEAFEQAGLVLTHQPEGTEGRGRYIGVRP